MAKQIWDMAISVPKEFVEFEETRPVLAELQQRGYRLAVLTNLRRDMTELTQQLGIGQYLEFTITGREVGEKPATAISKPPSSAWRLPRNRPSTWEINPSPTFRAPATPDCTRS